MVILWERRNAYGVGCRTRRQVVGATTAVYAARKVYFGIYNESDGENFIKWRK
jgi:hypothetical protein